MLTTIQVAQEDINQGIKEDCRRCPVALAIARVTTNCDISVARYIQFIHATGNNNRNFFLRLLPLHMQAWIGDFDFGYFVRPTAFKLEIPEKYLRK